MARCVIKLFVSKQLPRSKERGMRVISKSKKRGMRVISKCHCFIIGQLQQHLIMSADVSAVTIDLIDQTIGCVCAIDIIN
jgi:hypothetical protein